MEVALKQLRWLTDEVIDWLLTIALLFGWDIQANRKPDKWQRIKEFDEATKERG